MLVNRARGILESLRLHESIEITAEEQEELGANHLINVYSYSDYSELKSAALDVDMLIQQVRNISREMGSFVGPVSSGFRKPKRSAEDDARESYQAALAKLEEASGKKAVLEMLVYNPGTRSYVALGLVGRKAIADMTAWQSRFGNEELGAFIDRMKSMRTSMENAVTGASRIVDEFISPRPGMIRPELRGPALIASKAGADIDTFERAFGETPEQNAEFDYNGMEEESDSGDDFWGSGTDYETGLEEDPYSSEDSQRDEDDLFTAAYLTSDPGRENYKVKRLFEARSALRRNNLDSGDIDLKAAAIADVPSGQEGSMLDRMRWLKMNMTLPDENDVAWLARSKYSVEDVKSRFDGLIAALVTSGHQENTDLRAACAIMAGSPQPVEVLTRRFETLASQLKYVFDTPTVAAGMLAGGPLEPDEAMHVFKEAVGVVSRANYFDDAAEVENLALLLTNGYGPDAQAVQSTPQVSTFTQVAPGVPEEVQRQGGTTPWYHWYYWHHRYYGRPTFWNYRMHPGHMHTVPHFG
jgi:hypothetical protein